MDFILKKSKKFSKKRQSPYLLLELLIAFVLVVMCAVPLFHPHAFMLSKEKRFVREIELNRAVDVIYGTLIERLHENKVPWDEMENNVWKDIDPSLMDHDKNLAKSLAYKGKYQIGFRGKENEQKKFYHLKIILSFIPIDPKAQPMEYEYSAVVQRDIPMGREAPVTEPPKPDPSIAPKAAL